MSPSGAEVLRQIKSRIDEVDPAAVREQVGNGAVIVDVREPEEWARRAHPRRRSTFPRAISSRGSRAPSRIARTRGPLLRLGQPLGVGRTDADRGSRLRACRVDDRWLHALEGSRLRGRDAAHPDRRAARALLAPPAPARGRHRRPAEAARCTRAAAGRRRAGIAGRAVPGCGGRGNARHRRQRRGRPVQPPAPGDPLERADRRPQGRLGRADDQRAEPGREGREVPGPARRREHRRDHLRLRRDRRRPR